MGQPSTVGAQFGNFELLTRIAKGGMAEIYLARQAGMPGFERLVVIKKILPHLAEEHSFVQMFLQEARLAALVSHPNVVQIYDVGCVDGQYFIAMEYIPGVTLAALCRHARKHARPLSVHAALELVAQACDGLESAHQMRDVTGLPLGVVHRDVSPQNLMVTPAGILKIVDFGIAKATSVPWGTEHGALKGKYPYMSPEQVNRLPLDPRSDLFSLGTVLYELLTTRCPFDRSSELKTLQAITEEAVPPPSTIARELPPLVDALAMRALARNRKDRFTTAAEMAAKTRLVLDEMGRRSSPELVTQELALRFSLLFTEERATVEDAVSSVRTAMFAVQTRAESAGARRARRRRAVRIGGLAALALTLAAATIVLVAIGRTRGSTERERPWAAMSQGFVSSGPALRLGIVPFLSRDVLRSEMEPLVAYLARTLRRRIDVGIGASYEEVTRDLVRGQIHLALLPPVQYVHAKDDEPRVQLLATQVFDGSRSYEGYLITRDDTGIDYIEELAGKRFCYVEPGSSSGHLLPRTYLRRSGLDPDRLFAATHMSGDHQSVMRDLLAGRCDAGAVYSGALLGARDLGLPAGRLRVLAVTGRLPYDSVCAGPGLDSETAARVRKALVSLDPSRDLGTPSIGRTLRISGFIPGDESAFTTVREALRLESAVLR